MCISVICGLVIILAVISGFAYWLGGQGDGGRKAHPTWPKWVFDRWVRPLGCTLCALTALVLLKGFNDLLILSGMLMYAAVTCYWNFLKPQDDKTWWNWALHGLFIGLSLLPYGIATHQICATLGYAMALSATMTIWSEKVDDDFLEETGRGLLIVLVLILFVLIK